jgi:hypothetical protein
MKRMATHNIGFAIWRVKCFFETFVLVESSGIFSNFGAEKPPHRKAEKRQAVKKPTFLLNLIL